MAYFGGIFFANMGGGGGQNYFQFMLGGTDINDLTRLGRSEFRKFTWLYVEHRRSRYISKEECKFPKHFGFSQNASYQS